MYVYFIIKFDIRFQNAANRWTRARLKIKEFSYLHEQETSYSWQSKGTDNSACERVNVMVYTSFTL